MIHNPIQSVLPPPIRHTMGPSQQKSVLKSSNGRGSPYLEILPRGHSSSNNIMDKDTPKMAFNRRCLKEQHIPIRWVCIKCDYNNYNDVSVCGICKRPKSDCVRIEASMTGHRESRVDGKAVCDEWKCPQCAQFNYVFRDVCRSCHFHISRTEKEGESQITSHPNKRKRFP